MPANGWWKRLFSRDHAEPRRPLLESVVLTAAEWNEEPGEGTMRHWRSARGATLSLTLADSRVIPPLSDVDALRRACRGLAEGQGGGLVEADVVDTQLGRSARLIYKRLQLPAFVFTGMLWMPCDGSWLVWTNVDGERGTTGIREAAVTTRLFNTGLLTIEGYQESWAQDPYDPAYNRVDRRTLCYMSDAERYDAEFPDHPLSSVRRTLNQLSRAESLASFSLDA